MFSVKGDTVVDPFLGTGTTLRAAAAGARNSVGYEIEPGFRTDVFCGLDDWAAAANARVAERIDDHLRFVEECRQTGRALRHRNGPHGSPWSPGRNGSCGWSAWNGEALEPDWPRRPTGRLPRRAGWGRGPPPSDGQLSLF